MSVSSKVLGFLAIGVLLSTMAFFLLAPHRVERIGQYFSAVVGG